eukprot:1129894-Prymnesium_polylepis.1
MSAEKSAAWGEGHRAVGTQASHRSAHPARQTERASERAGNADARSASGRGAGRRYSFRPVRGDSSGCKPHRPQVRQVAQSTVEDSHAETFVSV